MKYWEIIADNLKKAGWSYGYVSAIDREGRAIWIADAHRNGNRFVVRADEKLTAFLEFEAAIRSSVFALTSWRRFITLGTNTKARIRGRVKKALSRCFLPLFQTCSRTVNYRENERKYL